MKADVFAGFVAQLKTDLTWADRANCRNMDIELFFPEVGKNIDPFAREVCSVCDVREQCLWYANKTGTEDGLFGGLSPNQRKHWRSRNKISLGMSYDDWRKSQTTNLLHVVPDQWRNDEQAV